MKIIAVYLDEGSEPLLFEEKDRSVANAYLRAFGTRQAYWLETVETTNTTFEEIAQKSGHPLVLVQKWAKEDTEAERLQRDVERVQVQKEELEAKIAKLQRQIEGL